MNISFRELEYKVHEYANRIRTLRCELRTHGGRGRDDRGHIWIGVSAKGLLPSAHLFELDPKTGAFTGRGDAVAELHRARIYRIGESQQKIHTKILQAADGLMYFASMDTRGEKEDGSRRPLWGSHLWRLHPKHGQRRWCLGQRQEVH